MSIANPKLYGEAVARGEVERRLAVAVDWRTPTSLEVETFRKHRILSELADELIAAADVDDEAWLLLERDWFGFPDPARFAFIAYRSDGARVCAAELDTPSELWRMPPGVPFDYSKVG